VLIVAIRYKTGIHIHVYIALFTVETSALFQSSFFEIHSCEALLATYDPLMNVCLRILKQISLCCILLEQII
jgi:hypothetical protein